MGLKTKREVRAITGAHRALDVSAGGLAGSRRD